MKLTDKTAIYFSKTKKIAEEKCSDKIITLQFFQRHENVVLCGINEVLDLLENNTDTSKYSIKYMPEGSIVRSKEVVLELEGPYHLFGIYEGLIDGILARQSSIATNARNIKIAAKNKHVVSMADRADHYRNQESDAYAIECGGIVDHATLLAAKHNIQHAFGSMPHALIQMCEGDLIKACEFYSELFPESDLVALVDFNNDVITDTLKVLNKFGSKLKAIRVDTSPNMKDKMFEEYEDEYGVNPEQIKRLKRALVARGGEHVKIIVSSGFNADKIHWFEQEKTPVDIYGVGAALLKINISFSADATKVNDKKIAKAGRFYSFNEKLITYN
ncbi:nicotinate phosphoribosyltransferase [Mycoplasma phocoenae]|uniref:nicotinate phosphoribosyltransferase n=1 Tax=Mycoplasma phocoenae TaxID=754517 RepID=A0A858U481_9MOLU|nr:nicotinate phosphoribosyltransferase [Mycoplasma phocoenae]QJG66831.1 nicotinate phosphoribosyltransferase [Mycoplasma phocoenae]